MSNTSLAWTTATTLSQTCAKVAHSAARIRGEEHRQDHVLELSESVVPRQRDIQHQRGLPQSVQFRLGWQAADCRGRGVAQSQGGFRAVEEPQHQLSYKVEAKGKDRNEISFFAKFVLCSNNESLPVIIDEGETRYWVRKISSLQSDDTDFLEKLKAEIPAFLFHLQGRTLSTEHKSRMWFAPEQIATDALRRIIRCNRNRLEVEMSELFLEVMENTQTDSLQFCLNDAIALLQCNHVKTEKHLVRKIVQDCWKLQPSENALTYTSYEYNYNSSGHYSPTKRVGRFYTVTRDKLNSI